MLQPHRALSCFRSSRIPLRLSRSFSSIDQSSSSSSGGFSFPAPRSLDQIVKLELLKNEGTTAINQIWNDYHKEKTDCIAKALDNTTYTSIIERARSAPYFVFPVHRQEGFFNMLCQFQDHCFLVTYLEAYKENPALAPPCLTISLFDDLLDQKQLGLVRVDIVNMLDKMESETLLNQILASYTDAELFKWVETFNKRPQEFHFDAYHEAIQRHR